MFLRSLCVVACLSALIPAQRGGEAGEAAVEELQRRKAQAAAEGSDVLGEKGGDPDSELAKMTPEQRLNHNIRHGASAYCVFYAHVRPQKLMPGQTGTLIVTASLRGQTVLQAPAPLEVTSAPNQALLTFGSPNFRPAQPGKLHTGYLGKPVYDNTATFEMGVTLSTEAVVGRKIPVAVDLKFDLHDGVSTQPIGRFTDRAVTEIEVGLSADPSVISGVHATGASVKASLDAPEAGSDAAKAPGAEPKDKAVAAAPVHVTAEPKPPEPAPVQRDPVIPADDESAVPLPMTMIVGGGVVLLLLVVLIAKRR